MDEFPGDRADVCNLVFSETESRIVTHIKMVGTTKKCRKRKHHEIAPSECEIDESGQIDCAIVFVCIDATQQSLIRYFSIFTFLHSYHQLRLIYLVQQ